MVRDLALSRVHGIAEETVSEATRLLTPQVAQLYTWWRAAAQARSGGLPLRRDFDIADHAAIVPDLFLVEVLPRSRFQFRLEGERVIELFGVNNTGRVISREQDQRDFGHALAEYYESIVAEGQCRRCLGTLDVSDRRQSMRFESIDCPLSRDGGQVDFILGVTATIAQD